MIFRPFVLASDSALAWTISVSSRTRRKEVTFFFFFFHLKVDVCNRRLHLVHVNLVSWHNSHHSPYAHFSKVLSINWQVMGSTPVVQLREMRALGRRKVSVLSLGQFFFRLQNSSDFLRIPFGTSHRSSDFFRLPFGTLHRSSDFSDFLRLPFGTSQRSPVHWRLVSFLVRSLLKISGDSKRQ